MTKIITTVILFFCFTSFSLAQKLDLNLIEKLTNIAFHSSLDDLMIHGYGFKKLREEDKGLTRVYARYNGDLDIAMMISIISSSKSIESEVYGVKHFERIPNILEIAVDRNYNIASIKDDIISKGFEYVGTNEALVVYKKGKYTYLIKKEPNKSGVTHISLINEDYVRLVLTD